MPKAKRVDVGVCVIACALLAARGADAHTRGLSRSSFSVAPDGAVHAELRLATADLPAEARAGGPALAELAVRGVDVRADGASCPARFAGSRPDGSDGLAIDIDFACPSGAALVEAELYLLSDLGASHQDVASLTAGSKRAQAALDGAHRVVRLETGASTAGRARARAGWAIGAGCVAAGAAVLVALRRRRRR